MMKIALAASAALLAAPAAYAASPSTVNQGGHWEWRSMAQPGPRAPAQALRRVWVPDDSQSDANRRPMMERMHASCMSMMMGGHAG
jgi:hypothetical protein